MSRIWLCTRGDSGDCGFELAPEDPPSLFIHNRLLRELITSKDQLLRASQLMSTWTENRVGWSLLQTFLSLFQDLDLHVYADQISLVALLPSSDLIKILQSKSPPYRPSTFVCLPQPTYFKFHNLLLQNHCLFCRVLTPTPVPLHIRSYPVLGRTILALTRLPSSYAIGSLFRPT
ncbi:hypothetical protein EJ08DRAFT_21066 [Tothia fuscella]|uniref:Uncharacterized protein n=1 Tax=Tothia fuscella TaxID=1048955 RepID=A0A9P4U0W0_9PEZI|nr:hypothetical protein EJ08DRAFT_21066 [Tothia fuscella]